MKSQIARYFDIASKTYDEAASIQQIVAEYLSKKIDKRRYANVLELGIGSGTFTRQIVNNIQYNSYTAIDISAKMIKTAKEKFLDNLLYIKGDIDSLPFKDNMFDLIVSSSTLQWIQKPKESIRDIIRKLKVGGDFYFSIFVDGTFKEMKSLYHLTGFGSTFPLKPADFYIDILEKSGAICQSELRTYVFKYPSVKDMLAYHKKTGARYTKNSKMVGKNQFIKFCKLYEKLYSTGDSMVKTTFSILYVWGKKRHQI